METSSLAHETTLPSSGAQRVNRNECSKDTLSSVYAVAVHPNGDIITGSYDNTAIIWNTDGEQKKVLRGHTGPVSTRFPPTT